MTWLITGAFPKNEALFAKLEQAGHTVTFVQDERVPLTQQGIDPAVFEGVVCNGLFLYTPIEQFTSLRCIQLTAAGFDRVPLDYIRAHGIELHNARGVYSVPMAEFALCGVLQLYKQSRFFYDNQKLHKWEKHRGLRELCGKTVCIVGCGSVGTECARRFAAFGCTVVGVDAAPYENAAYERMEPPDRLDAVLKAADVLVLTVPLTEGTRHLLNEERLGLLPDGAVVVNIARGGVVDTKALERHLPRLGGAVLDVFETEPLPPDSPLWDAENVLLTPHNSFVGEGNEARLEKTILKLIRK